MAYPHCLDYAILISSVCKLLLLTILSFSTIVSVCSIDFSTQVIVGCSQCVIGGPSNTIDVYKIFEDLNLNRIYHSAKEISEFFTGLNSSRKTISRLT